MKNNKNPKNLDGIVKSEDIIGKAQEDKSVPTSEIKKSTKIVDTKPKKIRKTSFLGQVISELRKVEWPSFKYVVGWSATIILFTALIGSVLGFTDYYFESGVKFVDCTSPNGSKNQGLQECFKDLTTDLTFQKYFNRDIAKSNTPAASPESGQDNSVITPTLQQPTINSSPDTLVTPETTNEPGEAQVPATQTTTPSTK